jgi:predicted nucleic acid-binding protein
VKRKQRIYLDTSIISYLDQKDSPEKMAVTHKLWKKILADEYDVVISEILDWEIDDCDENKKKILKEFENQLQSTIVLIGEEEKEIAESIIENGILTQTKSYRDCLHIAAAIVANCDVLLSWNFKHIVNPKTIDGVKIIAIKNGYKEMHIYSPEIFIGGDE